MASADTVPSIDELRCYKCQCYLSVGPVSLDKEGYICGRCPNERGCVIAIYDVVAKNFLFPCKYESMGCKERFGYGNMEKHERMCDKQPFACPIIGQCTWQGSNKNMVQHLNEKHPDNLLNSRIFEVKLDERFEKSFVLPHNGMLYLIDLTYRHEQSLSFTLMQIGLQEGPKQYTLKLFSKDLSKELLLKSLDVCFYVFQRNPSIVKKEEIEYSILKSFGLNNISLEVCLDMGTDERILKVLECPVCIEYMSPPIYICQNGHSFCESCKNKISVCSFCKSKMGNSRNYSLEHLSGLVYPPCKNHKLGCTFRSLLSEVKQHEVGCLRYKCPLDGKSDGLGVITRCKWFGTYEELLEHSKTAHSCIQGDKFVGSCSMSMKKDSYILVYAYGHLFSAVSRTEPGKGLYFDMVFVGPPELTPKFGFYIEFKAGAKRLIYYEACKYVSEGESVFKNCLSIGGSALIPFIDDNSFVRINVRIIEANEDEEERATCFFHNSV